MRRVSNSGRDQLPTGAELDPPDDLLAQAVAMGCTFAIDSDAHSPGQLEWVAIGCDRAAKAGIGPERIINCRRGHPLGDATV